jgi:ABC-2 type transport system permease protein
MGADADLEALAESIKPMLRGERSLQGENGPIQLFAAILIPADLESRIVRPGGLALPSLGAGRGGGIEFWSSNLADSELRGVIESAVNEEVRRREYARRGLDAEAVRAVQRSHAPFVSLDPTKAAGEEEVSLADVMRQFVPIAFVYLLWIAIFTISQMLLSNTIEEKSNRIIEVLLSSVTAGELMMGKLLGIAAIGLTMIGAWLGSMIAILLWFAGPEIDWAPQVLQILLNSKLLPAFALYFVLGYLMYAGIFLAIGGVCNTLKEAQNLMGPVMLIMMVPLITMFFIPKDPHGGLARALSWIPLYTPFVMMNRAAADPPAFDLIGTFILMAASTVVVLWLTGRIFRIGILRTGQPPKLMELFRWLKG